MLFIMIIFVKNIIMIALSEYSFIQFSADTDNCCCDQILEVEDLSKLIFYIGLGSYKSHITTIYGDIIGSTNQFITSDWSYVFLQELSTYDLLACKDCFRIAIEETDGTMNYSNILLYNQDTDCSFVQFRSKNETYFKYSDDYYWSVWLPLEMVNRNPNTDAEEYVDANGWIHNPYKMRRGIYDLNVDYCPVDLHKKIEVMLMHDLIIDDIEVNETGEYQVDYEEFIYEFKRNLYKASTEVSEQEVQMLRNY